MILQPEIITKDMEDATGEFFIDDPLFHGRVSELSSWKHPEFRALCASFLAKRVESDANMRQFEREEKERKQREIADRIRVIPELYLKDTDKRYAMQPRAAIRRWGTEQRSIRKPGTLRKSLFIYGQSGRGKSHYAGKLLESIADLGRIEWMNAEELDDIIQKASSGNTEWNRMLLEIIDGINKARYVVIDDLGKADTKCDGITVPKRISPIHKMLEDARVHCNKQFIITSEFAPNSQQLRGKLSDGVVNRMNEMCDIVHIEEPERFIDWMRNNQ